MNHALNDRQRRVLRALTATIVPGSNLAGRVEAHLLGEGAFMRLTLRCTLELLEHLSLDPRLGGRRFSTASEEQRTVTVDRYANSRLAVVRGLLRWLTFQCFLHHYGEPQPGAGRETVTT